MHFEYTKCELCARKCGVDRNIALGYCRSSAKMRIALADLHLWEEPIISGTRGSGTVFFSGCSLGCRFCQNADISRTPVGKEISEEGLAKILLGLEARGAHNVSFVTPTHFTPSIKRSVSLARELGLSVPTVYNTGSYDTVETVKSLCGSIDVYLPDYKFYRPQTAKSLAFAEDYPIVAMRAIEEMVLQQPKAVIENGIMKKGVIVRILLLPGHLAEAKLSLGRLFRAFGNSIYYSLMGQYTVVGEQQAPLNRRVTASEYSELIEYADKLGVLNGFTQELSSSDKKYIPEFKK